MLLLSLILGEASSAAKDFAIVGINVIPMNEERLIENQVVAVSVGGSGEPGQEILRRREEIRIGSRLNQQIRPDFHEILPRGEYSRLQVVPVR